MKVLVLELAVGCEWVRCDEFCNLARTGRETYERNFCRQKRYED